MKTVLFLLAVVSLPAYAGLINFDVSGTLGPSLGGTDPLHLSGEDFTLSGSFSQDLVPIGSTSDSATYALPATIEIQVGAVVLTAYNATLTITDPASGDDTVSLGFSVLPMIFTPDVYTLLSLPEGTLNGTGIQEFTASFDNSTSILAYDVIGDSAILGAELGIAGTISITGAGGSIVPEPGTIGLLGAGLLAFACMLRRRKCDRACAIVKYYGYAGESRRIRYHSARW